MKPFPLRSLLGLLLATACASLLSAAPQVIGEQFFQDTNTRIENIFHYRLNPPKPPGPLDDPFRLGDAPLANSLNLSGDATGLTGTVPTAPTDESLLRQAAGTLVFGGILQVNDVQVLVINKASYKQGGILAVRLQGTPIYLRILSITNNSVTLGLNEARLTLHF